MELNDLRNKQTSAQIEALLEKILAFYKEREWEKFHSPKNLVMVLASEMGELIEPFRWLTEEESYNPDEKTREAIGDEIGDLLIVLLYLSHKLGIDPLQMAYEKLEKIGQKYPVSLCKGKSHKYTAYTQV